MPDKGFFGEGKITIDGSSAHTNIPTGAKLYLCVDGKCSLEWFHPNCSEVASAVGLGAETGDYLIVHVNREG